VNLTTAQGKTDEDLVTVCCGDEHSNIHAPTPIRMKRYCESCASDVEYSYLQKASKQGTSYTIVTTDEVRSAQDATLEVTGQMLAATVHVAAEVESATLPGKDRSTYYLEPASAAQLGKYGLIVDMLTRHPELAALVVYSPRTKPGLYRLSTFDGVLTLEPLAWPEDVKATPNVNVIEPAPEYQAKVDALAAKTTEPFDADAYRNTYREALVNLLASKESVEGVEIERTKSTPAAKVGTAVDLGNLLDELLA
jgi:non-homologous end joining protein Ku